MHQNEIEYLKQHYPLIGEVLRSLIEGEKITADSPLWDTYLMARQRGLVQREGDDKLLIKPSTRGDEYMSRK